MLNFQKERSYLLLNTSPFSNFSRFDLTYLKCLSTFAFQVNKIQTELQDTISQLKSLQGVLQMSQKTVQEKEKKVEELDKMLNESMEELQQKDKNLKEKESKVVELDKALKERQWELKQKAAQVRTRNTDFVIIVECQYIACRTGVIFLHFAGEREGGREARGERGA